MRYSKDDESVRVRGVELMCASRENAVNRPIPCHNIIRFTSDFYAAFRSNVFTMSTDIRLDNDFTELDGLNFVRHVANRWQTF